jgi:hypothetical protein
VGSVSSKVNGKSVCVFLHNAFGTYPHFPITFNPAAGFFIGLYVGTEPAYVLVPGAANKPQAWASMPAVVNELENFHSSSVVVFAPTGSSYGRSIAAG